MARRFSPSAGQIVHVTVRCNNKEFLLNPEQHHEVIFSWLNTLPYFFGIELHHVLLMTNHMHLLLTPHENNIGEGMSYFLTNLAKSLNYSLQRNNHVFGDRYRPTVIDHHEHLLNVIRYIYQNPLRANMVDQLVDYLYSSLGFYLGTGNNGLRVTPDPYTASLLSLGVAGLETWIDRVSINLGDQDTQNIRTSLQRKTFKFSKIQRASLKEYDSKLLS